MKMKADSIAVVSRKFSDFKMILKRIYVFTVMTSDGKVKCSFDFKNVLIFKCSSCSISDQCTRHTETSLLNYTSDQFTGFHMMGK